MDFGVEYLGSIIGVVIGGITMYSNGEHRYNQQQIQARATYYGLYLYYSCHENLSGRNLKLRIAKEMANTRKAIN